MIYYKKDELGNIIETNTQQRYINANPIYPYTHEEELVSGFDGYFYVKGTEPQTPLNYYKEIKLAQIKATIALQEQKAQRSSQEITEALLTKQEAKQADIDAFTALHSAKKLNQDKLLEVANATSKEQVEAIQVVQVEYKNGTWLEL